MMGATARRWIEELGLPRILIFAFLVAMWLVAAFATKLSLGSLLTDSLVRTGMNGVLVLALVPMVRAGSGLNFGLPLGILCGLGGCVLALELRHRAPGPFDAIGDLGLAAAPIQMLVLAALFGIAAAAPVGWGYGVLLERVRGQEMMVGLYVGFGSAALLSIVWLVLPVSNPEIIWPLGGRGVRYSVPIASAFVASPTQWRTGELVPLLLVFAAACGVVAFFSRTLAGASLDATGQNERLALASGIDVVRSRRSGVVLSTVLAAAGAVIFAHGMGLVQVYKMPVSLVLPSVAALLLGGGSVSRASVLHVVAGTFLFQSLVASAQPVVNALVARSENVEALNSLPEVSRMIVANGVILYALTRRG